MYGHLRVEEKKDEAIYACLDQQLSLANLGYTEILAVRNLAGSGTQHSHACIMQEGSLTPHMGACAYGACMSLQSLLVLEHLPFC